MLLCTDPLSCRTFRNAGTSHGPCFLCNRPNAYLLLEALQNFKLFCPNSKIGLPNNRQRAQGPSQRHLNKTGWLSIYHSAGCRHESMMPERRMGMGSDSWRHKSQILSRAVFCSGHGSLLCNRLGPNCLRDLRIHMPSSCLGGSNGLLLMRGQDSKGPTQATCQPFMPGTRAARMRNPQATTRHSESQQSPRK